MFLIFVGEKCAFLVETRKVINRQENLQLLSFVIYEKRHEAKEKRIVLWFTRGRCCTMNQHTREKITFYWLANPVVCIWPPHKCPFHIMLGWSILLYIQSCDIFEKHSLFCKLTKITNLQSNLSKRLPV